MRTSIILAVVILLAGCSLVAIKGSEQVTVTINGNSGGLPISIPGLPLPIK